MYLCKSISYVFQVFFKSLGNKAVHVILNVGMS